MTSPLKSFVGNMTRLVSQPGAAEDVILAEGVGLLRALVSTSDWLGEDFARPGLDCYRQYLLHCDPLERFSVVSFVWGPNQFTPIHDHTVWGMIGMLRGREGSQRFAWDEHSGRLAPTGVSYLQPGDVEVVSPRVGDIHKVWNDVEDEASISIHVYGGNIGRIARHIYESDGGARRNFISGYTNDVLPNIWAK